MSGAPSLPQSLWMTALAAGLIVLCTVAAYHNSFLGPFIYDDVKAIAENRSIQRLWPLGPVLSPPCDGQTVSGRPTLNFSLAINYALGGLDVWPYHAANLLIHIIAALLLFGIVRRTLLGPALGDRFGKAATPLALTAALLWAVHPLQTESVTFIAQRAESLAGMFYLLTLYCVIRGAGGFEGGSDSSAIGAPQAQEVSRKPRAADAAPISELSDSMKGPPIRDAGTVPFSVCKPVAARPHPNPLPWGDGPIAFWYTAAVLACLLGMATKEIMVTAPLIVLVYDRTFLSGSFLTALRRRGALYAALAATWGLLVYLVLSTRLIFRQPEMGAPDAWSYACTQPGVILHYLRLSLWPKPLVFDYGWPVARGLGKILPAAIAIGLLAAATVWGTLRRRPWGFLGAWFLLILAPTSSVSPLGQLAFEHRMYLSLAAVTVLAVTGGYGLWDRLLRYWEHGHRVRFMERGHLARFMRPRRPRRRVRWAVPVAGVAAAVLALGGATVARNCDYHSAEAIYQDTVNKRPDNPAARNNLGNALCRLGRFDAAIEHYRHALSVKPGMAQAYNNLGNALQRMGRLQEAIPYYEYALRLKPDDAGAHFNLAMALAAVGKTTEAIEHFSLALQLNPEHAAAHYNLAVAQAALGRVAEAIEHYQEVLRLKPDDADIHYHLAVALVAAGKTNEAIDHFRETLRLKPDDAKSHNELGNALTAADRIDEAIEQYREALRWQPDNAKARNNLGLVLATSGRTDGAIAQLNEALRLSPDDPGAHYNLGNIFAGLGNWGEAISHYQQALQRKPDWVEAHYNLGVTLAEAGRFDEAIEHYQQVLHLQPNDSDAQDKLAIASIGHYSQLVQQSPRSLEALNNLAWLLATHDAAHGGDPARAVELAQWARKLGGHDSAPCLDTLAAAYAAAGRFDEAVATAEQAARLAASAGQNALAEKITSRVEVYRAGRPYRQPPTAH